jgi:hypothetical protein
MPASKQPKTTKSSSPASGSASVTRPDWVGALNPRWSRDGRVFAGKVFGSWTVLSPDLETMSGALYAKCRCVCGTERAVSLRMMECGRSTQCKGCGARQTAAKHGRLVLSDPEDGVLQKRVGSMRQRCTNPKDASYKNYGGRGIEFRFASVKEAVDYIKQALSAPTYRGLDLDRKDNNGHYEPGNLRLVTRSVNARNTRRAVISDADLIWAETGSPYQPNTTLRMLRAHLTRDDILEAAQTAVIEKRKNWRTIRDRLCELSTYSTPGPATGSSSETASSTTASTGPAPGPCAQWPGPSTG